MTLRLVNEKRLTELLVGRYNNCDGCPLLHGCTIKKILNENSYQSDYDRAAKRCKSKLRLWLTPEEGE